MGSSQTQPFDVYMDIAMLDTWYIFHLTKTVPCSKKSLTKLETLFIKCCVP